MQNKLIFGGIDSSDYNVFISGTDTFSAPERDVQYVQVAGRNGDLIVDNGRWNNIQVSYPAFIPNTFENRIGEFRAAMMQKTGYQKLEDTYHPEEYRMASFSYGLNPSNITAFHRFGEFALTFNCKPQRYLKAGDEPLQFIPVVVSGNDWSTQYVPVNGDIKFTASTASTLTVTLRTYDSTGTQLTSTNYSCADGAEQSKAFSGSDVYWRMFFSVGATTDPTYITVTGATIYNGETITLNAKVGRNFEFENPTGYTSKPMIEFFATYLASTTLKNFVNGEQQNWFSFSSSTLSNSQTHGFLDCELQYLYDETKANQSNKLTITTAQGPIGQALVFPELGSGTITLNMYYLVASLATGSGLIQIYPKWWTL